jgi:hypothetical protein
LLSAAGISKTVLTVVQTMVIRRARISAATSSGPASPSCAMA